MAAERCQDCRRRRETRTVDRYGGGDYRRAGRWYTSSICEECAHGYLRPRRGQELHYGDQALGWSLLDLAKEWPLPDDEPAPSPDLTEGHAS